MPNYAGGDLVDVPRSVLGAIDSSPEAMEAIRRWNQSKNPRNRHMALSAIIKASGLPARRAERLLKSYGMRLTEQIRDGKIDRSQWDGLR